MPTFAPNREGNLLTPQKLAQEQARFIAAYSKVAAALKPYQDIQQIGIGAKEKGGKILQQFAFRIYVKQKRLLQEIPLTHRIPKTILGFPTDVLNALELETASCPAAIADIDQTRYRKTGLQGGMGIRNMFFERESDKGFGTIGCMARTNSGNLLVGLTCEHVVHDAKPSNHNPTKAIKIGQPKISDSCCGCGTSGIIGKVKTAVRSAVLDCATVEITDSGAKNSTSGKENLVRGKDTAGGTPTTITIAGVAQAQCFSYVKKRGRSSGYTEGQIIDILFQGSQILIERTDKPGYPFACKGDSGSVILNADNKVVGLLHSIDSATSKNGIANHIGPVMGALDIKIAGVAAGIPNSVPIGLPASNCNNATQISGPKTLVRGTSATYTIINPPVGATYSNWRFEALTIETNRPGNNNVDNWAGVMAQSGELSVDITSNGTTTKSRLNITVTDRVLPDNLPPEPLGRSGNGPLPNPPRLARDLGRTRIAESGGFTTETINSGPNLNWNYIKTANWGATVTAFSNDALYDSWHVFHSVHDSGFPGIVAIADLVIDVEAHEGITARPASYPATYRSHYGQGLHHLAQSTANQINQSIENLLSHTSFESRLAFQARAVTIVDAQRAAFHAAVDPHPTNHYTGSLYLNYPYIMDRSVNRTVASGNFFMRRTGGVPPFRWQSLVPGVATINNLGEVTPRGAGTAKISLTDNTGVIDSVDITLT